MRTYKPVQRRRLEAIVKDPNSTPEQVIKASNALTVLDKVRVRVGERKDKLAKLTEQPKQREYSPRFCAFLRYMSVPLTDEERAKADEHDRTSGEYAGRKYTAPDWSPVTLTPKTI